MDSLPQQRNKRLLARPFSKSNKSQKSGKGSTKSGKSVSSSTSSVSNGGGKSSKGYQLFESKANKSSKGEAADGTLTKSGKADTKASKGFKVSGSCYINKFYSYHMSLINLYVVIYCWQLGTSSSKANKSSKSHNIFDGAENGTSKSSKPGTIPFIASANDLFGSTVNVDKEDDGSSTDADYGTSTSKAQYPPLSAWSETEEDEVTDTLSGGTSSSFGPDDFESNKEIINPNTFSETTAADGSGGFPVGGYIGIAAAVVALVGALLWAHKVRSRPRVPVVEEGEQAALAD